MRALKINIPDQMLAIWTQNINNFYQLFIDAKMFFCAIKSILNFKLRDGADR